METPTPRQIIEKDLRESIDFAELGFDIKHFINFILDHPDEAPFRLVYRNKDGKVEINRRIRDDLSTLEGYIVLDCNKAPVVLLRPITNEVLKEYGCNKPTIGDLRQIASSKLHPEAKPIDSYISSCIWKRAEDYYLLRYLLGLKGFSIPDISYLISIEEDDSNESPYVTFNSSGGFWDYSDGDAKRVFIEHMLPMLCYRISE